MFAVQIVTPQIVLARAFHLINRYVRCPLEYMGIKLAPKLSKSSLNTLRLKIVKIY